MEVRKGRNWGGRERQGKEGMGREEGREKTTGIAETPLATKA